MTSIWHVDCGTGCIIICIFISNLAFMDDSARTDLNRTSIILQITGQSCPLSFKGSPYWMAPEVNERQFISLFDLFKSI